MEKRAGEVTVEEWGNYKGMTEEHGKLLRNDRRAGEVTRKEGQGKLLRNERRGQGKFLKNANKTEEATVEGGKKCERFHN